MADRYRDQQQNRGREPNRLNREDYNAQNRGYGSNYSGAGYRRDLEDDYIQDIGREYYDQEGNRGRFITGAQGSDYWRAMGGREADYGRGQGDRYRTTGGQGSREPGRGQSEGSHRGKGPRNYQRSQERIREDVCERLTDDGMIDATNMDVRVENNEVVLSGTVHNREEKRRAEDLAEAVAGVRNVENRLKVEAGGETDTNDYREYDERGRIRRGA